MYMYMYHMCVCVCVFCVQFISPHPHTYPRHNPLAMPSLSRSPSVHEKKKILLSSHHSFPFSQSPPSTPSVTLATLISHIHEKISYPLSLTHTHTQIPWAHHHVTFFLRILFLYIQGTNISLPVTWDDDLRSHVSLILISLSHLATSSSHHKMKYLASSPVYKKNQRKRSSLINKKE